MSRGIRPPHAVVAAAALLAAATAPAAAQSGGPTTVVAPTRAELIRKWDLNSDGKIDVGEAEVASSRMRRERANIRLNSGIDPITGRPRGELEQPEDAEPIVERNPDEVAAELFGTDDAKSADDDAPRDESPPGSRVPRSGRHDEPKPGVAKPVRGLPSRQPITGGVRGGGVAARPGYGDGSKAAPLNAGRPPITGSPAQGRSGQPGMMVRGPIPDVRTGPSAGAPRAGLVPQPRPPLRSQRSTQMFDPY